MNLPLHWDLSKIGFCTPIYVFRSSKSFPKTSANVQRAHVLKAISISGLLRSWNTSLDCSMATQTWNPDPFIIPKHYPFTPGLCECSKCCWRLGGMEGRRRNLKSIQTSTWTLGSWVPKMFFCLSSTGKLTVAILSTCSSGLMTNRRPSLGRNCKHFFI